MIILRVYGTYGTTTHNVRKCIDYCYCFSFNNLSNIINCSVLMYVIVPLSQVIMAENDSDREQEYHEEAPPPPVKKKKRGPTKLSRVIALTVEHKKKNHLELDEKNRPKGPTAKPFSSYLGTVARNRVDITINEWKHVNDDVKQQCWLDVYVCTFVF